MRGEGRQVLGYHPHRLRNVDEFPQNGRRQIPLMKLVLIITAQNLFVARAGGGREKGREKKV